MIVILGLILGLVAIVGFSLSPYEIKFGPVERKEKKSKKHEPYVIGVNQFLVPSSEWKKNLDAALNKMKTQYDNIEYPEDFVYLDPIPDPNEPPVVKYMRDRQRSADFRVSGTGDGYRSLFEDAISDHRTPYVPLSTPNEYRTGFGIGYTKECAKCLQPILKNPKDTYCEVCIHNIEHDKREAAERKRPSFDEGSFEEIRQRARKHRQELNEVTKEIQTLKDACAYIVDSNEWMERYGHI